MTRPSECCGACPPIFGGGYDCTCAGNPRCPGPNAIDRMPIDDATTRILNARNGRPHEPTEQESPRG